MRLPTILFIDAECITHFPRVAGYPRLSFLDASIPAMEAFMRAGAIFDALQDYPKLPVILMTSRPWEQISIVLPSRLRERVIDTLDNGELYNHIQQYVQERAITRWIALVGNDKEWDANQRAHLIKIDLERGISDPNITELWNALDFWTSNQTIFPSAAPMDRLCLDFPQLYSADFRFQFHAGWAGLVAQLSADLCDLASLDGIGAWSDLHPKVTIAKEKFGKLAFAVTQSTQLMRESIARHAQQSLHICERCGLAGSLRTHDGCYRTVCDACNEGVESGTLR